MHIKQHLLACALLAGIAPLTHAQSTSNLALGGSITPAACTITIQDNGVVDYGTINKANLNPDPALKTLLTDVILPTTVACSGPTRYAFRTIDNRIDSRGGMLSPEFGLGKATDGSNIGSLAVRLGYVVVLDGIGGFSTLSNDGGATWFASSQFVTNFPPVDVQPNVLHGTTTLSGSTAGPSMVTNGQFNLRMQAAIRPANQLTWTDDLTLDGSATLELVYL
jgi:hypothetical protein